MDEQIPPVSYRKFPSLVPLPKKRMLGERYPEDNHDNDSYNDNYNDNDDNDNATATVATTAGSVNMLR